MRKLIDHQDLELCPWHSVEGADQLMENISTSVPLGRFGTQRDAGSSER
jgi:hypothetical protein